MINRDLGIFYVLKAVLTTSIQHIWTGGLDIVLLLLELGLYRKPFPVVHVDWVLQSPPKKMKANIKFNCCFLLVPCNVWVGKPVPSLCTRVKLHDLGRDLLVYWEAASFGF